MPTRASRKIQGAAPAEVLSGLSSGYNGYTDPTLTNPKMWAAATNVFSGPFGYVQRARFANVYTQTPTGLPYTTFKYFGLPGVGSYLIADQNSQLYSYDTNAGYAQTVRLNPYVNPLGGPSSQLNGPWSREALGNILYEMNGQVKMAGRLANAATIEGWGLDAPDSTPQVITNTVLSEAITSITRANGIVTATLGLATSYPNESNGPLILNVTGVADSSFNGSFQITSGNGTAVFTWIQLGQDTTSLGGTLNNIITKAVGRSYAYAWENANKFHVGAPSPATQYIQYTNQRGFLNIVEPGTIFSTHGSTLITGVNTQFTSAWVGRHIWQDLNGDLGRIVSVSSPTSLNLATPWAGSSSNLRPWIVFDPQATHIRLYATADGQATYLRIARNAWDSTQIDPSLAGLFFNDNADAEPPNFPFTTELVQANNVPPPVGQFVNEYQGRLVVYGVQGAGQSFFYSNQESTTVGLPQESFAPLNQVTLPMQNASMNGMIEFPGSAAIWSDKQDMFRLTGLLTDNTVTGIAQSNAAAQQGATISRLPYNLGCASPFAVDITPLGAIWVTSNAEIWLFTDKYAPRNIGRPVQDILDSIIPAKLNLCRVKYYHTNTRNWLVVAVPANSANYNNTLLILDIDQLASNGSPSYFTFDMATNSPAWFVFQPGTTQVIGGVPTWIPRCDSLEVVYEQAGIVRLLTGQVDLIQDADFFQGGTGVEIAVPNGTLLTHAWGNDHPFVLTRPAWVRFNTNRDPSMLATDGWSFAVQGIDDDFYTFVSPLTVSLVPGVNDSSTLGGNPDFATSGLAFRHSPELFRIGGVNFVMGRRLRFQVNFPSTPGVNYQFRSVQMGFAADPPS